MSIKVTSWVWEAFPASGSELLAMLALADWGNDAGDSIYPSIRAVADKVRVSESQARRILRKFEKDGFIAVVGNHAGGKPGATRQYILNVELLKRLAVESETKKAEEKRLKDAKKRGGLDGSPFNPFNPTPGMDATPSMGATPGMDARDDWHGCAEGVAPVRETGGMGASQTVIEPLENHHLTQSIPAAVAPEVVSCEGGAALPPVSVVVPAPPVEPKPAKFNPVTALVGAGVEPQIAADWLVVRKTKKAAVTQTAIDGIVREAAKASLSLNDALRICCDNSWAGFKAVWLENQQAGLSGAAPATARLGFDPDNESTWGYDARGNFDGSLYIEHKRQVFLMRNGAQATPRDMGAAEVVE